MTTLVASAATEALDQLDELLDLADIRFKLANPEEGEPVAELEIDLMESEYRKFLALRIAHPETEIVPCKIVDEMWHVHILDTRAYAADCDRIFGSFMHHFPYFGMRGEADAEALMSAYEDTLKRYRDAFGEPPADSWTTSSSSGRCRTGCKPMRCR